MKKQNRWRRLIRKAVNVIKQSEMLCGNLAADGNYGPVCPTDENASKFCAVGALMNAANLTREICGNHYTGTSKDKVYNEAICRLNAASINGRLYEVNDRLSCYDQEGRKERIIAFMLKVADGD